jgi:hypothetical protein
LGVQLVNLIEDDSSGWLKELFEYVASMIAPDFKTLELVIAENLAQAKTAIEEQGESPSYNIGVGGFREGLKEPPWRSSVKLPDTFYMVEKPRQIRELGLIYEGIMEGMAHELAEAMVMKHESDKWYPFSPSQVAILSSFNKYPSTALNILRMISRERLTDKLAVEHGFAREQFCALNQTFLGYFSAYLERVGVGVGKPGSAGTYMTALAWDKSISLHAAGERELADSWLQVWSAYVSSKGDNYARFMNRFKQIRQELLRMPLSSDSFLELFNSLSIQTI